MIDVTEVASNILKSLKQDVETYFKRPLGNLRTVITVPIYYSDEQKVAMQQSTAMAGLHCMRVLSEPTAACVAAGYDQTEQEMRVIVFDFGESNFHITVLQVENGNIQVEGYNSN